MKQQITVDENVPVVNVTTQDISGQVGEQAIKDLPLNGRSYSDRVHTPGAFGHGGRDNQHVNYFPAGSIRLEVSLVKIAGKNASACILPVPLSVALWE